MTDQSHSPQGQAEGPENLGFAGGVAKTFINSPLSPLLFMAMLLLGVLGLIMTPRQEDPQISVPMVDVMIQYPGASAEQVASLAIEPLERIMSEIPGVEHVYSASSRGLGIVTVQYYVGEQLGPSLVKLYDKLQSNMDRIPPGVSPPLVKPKGIDDVPVVALTLWSNDVEDSDLRLLALDVLQSLKEIPNTGTGFVVGGRRQQVKVEVKPERLSGHSVSLDQVANTIRTANAEQAVGGLETGDTHFTVVTGSFLRSADDIKRLVVGTQAGVPVYVRDVADVSLGPEDAHDLVGYFTGVAGDRDLHANGAQAVTIAVAKKVGSNGVEVAGSIIKRVKELQNQLIPTNVHVAVTRDYGKTANEKVNTLILKLFIATGWVFLLVWLFFRSLRPAVVVLLVIPVVILFTVFIGWLTGYSVNRVSLFALIFAIGILVDDAIVVVENIYRRWLEGGRTDAQTAIDAVREVGNPTILATFTVIAALLPMGFVRGMMGPYMQPIPALGSTAMIISLLAAFVFTPWWAMRLKPSLAYLKKAEQREHDSAQWWGRLYRRILTPLIESRRKALLFRLGLWMAFAAACSMFYTTAVPVKMLPLDNKSEFAVTVDMPEGTALPTTANVVNELARKIRQLKFVTAVQVYVGTARPFDFNGMVRHYYLRNKPWQGALQVQLVGKHERKVSSHEIATKARQIITPIVRKAGGRLAVVEMPPGPPVLASVVAEVYGPNAHSRRKLATDLTAMFEKAPNITDVDNYLQGPLEYWRFSVDREKAVRRGISVDVINRNVAMAMGGYELGDIKVGRVLESISIIIQVPLAVRSQIARLNDLPIQSPDGGTIPLGELGHLTRVAEDPLIYHKDLRAVEYVVGDVTGRLAAPVYGMLQVEDELRDYTAPDGTHLKTSWFGYPWFGRPSSDHTSGFEWGGEWTVTYETFRDMGMAFLAALILIYVLVVWEFGNFRIPGLIMAPIPLTLLGIIPGHWLFGAEFSATSMIGWIALAGIIVRNSILLVDFSIHEVRRGLSVEEAVISSCRTRTRPIIITALALVAGSSVILSDPIFQGMAISLAFGVVVSTVLTLVVIPLGCVAHKSSLCEIVEYEGRGRCSASDKEGGGGSGPQGGTGFRPRRLVPMGLALWGKLVNVVVMSFYLLRGVFILAREAIRGGRHEAAGGVGKGADEGRRAAPSPARKTVAPIQVDTEGPGSGTEVVSGAKTGGGNGKHHPLDLSGHARAVTAKQGADRRVPNRKVSVGRARAPDGAVAKAEKSPEEVSMEGRASPPAAVDRTKKAAEVESPKAVKAQRSKVGAKQSKGKKVTAKAKAPVRKVRARKAPADQKVGASKAKAPPPDGRQIALEAKPFAEVDDEVPPPRPAKPRRGGARRGIRLKGGSEETSGSNR